MNTKLPFLLAAAGALSVSIAPAQDEPRPPVPPPTTPPVEASGTPPPDGERPPAPPGARPNGDRPRRGGDAGPREGEAGPRPNQPDGQRGPGGNRDGDRGADGARGPGNFRDGERNGPRDGERAGPREGRRNEGESSARTQKPTAYLGVSTGPLPAALGVQLSMPEGFGLLVEQVVPDSPAAKAGIQRYDVLKLLNDQQLVAPDQLAALVHSAGKDADVTVTVLRKGVEQKLTVKVGERLLPERPAGGRFGGLNLLDSLHQLPEVARDTARCGEDQGRRIQEQFRNLQERMGEFQKRVQEWQKNPTGKPPEAPKLDMPKPPEPPQPAPPTGAPEPPRPADLLRESRPGGAPEVRIDRDGNVTTWNTAQARIVIKDDRGEILVRNENGKRFATVKNPQGEIVFEGPVDTDEQRKTLPADARRKIELNGIETLARADGSRASAEEPRRPVPAGEPAIQ